MLAPQACVAVEIAGPAAADEQRAALERRCSEILGTGRCRVFPPEDAARAAACWQARVTGPSAVGADAPPNDASVTLDDPTEPTRSAVRRDITFRPNDAPVERWATLGLVIAALVTVEEHSAADASGVPERGPEGSGFAPVVTAPPPALALAFSPRGELRATGIGAVGALPRAAVGARLEASFGGERLAVLARGTLFPAGTRAALGAAGAGGTFELWSVGLGLCGLAERGGAWRARLCGGGELAHMSARGYGVAETNGATAWWQSAWVGASASRRVASHLALVAEVEGAVLFQRPTFAIEGAQAMSFSPAPVAATVALGVAVPLP
jgi:hypothetical protein